MNYSYYSIIIAIIIGELLIEYATFQGLSQTLHPGHLVQSACIDLASVDISTYI